MTAKRCVRRVLALGACLALALTTGGWLLATAAGRCGDGVCEGPETQALCPEDCGSQSAPSTNGPSGAENGEPNPLRAVVSEDLLEWRDWLDDGGFEEGLGAAGAMLHPAKGLSPVPLQWVEAAARTGDYGVRVETGAEEGIVLALRFELEKGEQTRCGFWARSLDGSTELRVSVLGVEQAANPRPTLLHAPDPFPVSAEWTPIEFVFENRRGVDSAYLAIDVGPNQMLDFDDASVEAEQWTTAEIEVSGRLVGGIPVPSEPVAPIHFNVLIHIEDPALITRQEAVFREKTAVFAELARVLHEHGGFLTIQPEEDWPLAAVRFAPETLADLATQYGVVYSTHTHGPSCIDTDGRLRSNQDCNECRTCSGWIDIEADSDPYTPQYVGALRDLISEVSGTNVRDHNGNWHYDNASALADVGIATWSAFKDHNTQATFEELFTNPWRPTACDAIETPEVFFRHDPSTAVIFLPGWGQAITRDPARLHVRLAAMLSQVLRFADADRVNCFYIVTHVDHYASDSGEPYIHWDDATGELTYGQEFLADLACWQETLTELVDPLVAEGYLEWTPLPEIGRLFEAWEIEHEAEAP